MLKVSSPKIIAKIVKQEIAKKGITKLVANFYNSLPRGEMYLVGGVVRDILMGRTKRGDLDFVVRGVAATDLKKFLTKYGDVNLVGRSFGVFKFRTRGRADFIDFALPRTEHARGSGAYRDFSVQSDPKLEIADDLGRRDFTVNALAWNTKTNDLVDQFGGLNDLRGGIIRAVGEPKERFLEDYSRILRALRFTTELNFEIEGRTWHAIKKLIPEINKKSGGSWIVPRETIAKEFLKSFAADPAEAFEWWNESGALAEIVPETAAMRRCGQPERYHAEGNVLEHTRLALRAIASPEFKKEFGYKNIPIYLALAVLFHDIGKPAVKKGGSPKDAGFTGHAAAGAKITREITNRLRLESYKAAEIDIETGRLAWLVGEHMFILHNDPKKLSFTEIESRFMRPDFPGDLLLALCWADIRGGKTSAEIVDLYMVHYLGVKNRIRGIRRRFPKGLPPRLLDGREVQNILKIKPGPRIAEILCDLRERQLEGKISTSGQAKKYLLSLE
ncbi:MAG: HD domain-containing protein [Patescibacteria group bacterium]|nr:HD domain-containing protein [Patescibacteria group bacterium]